MIDAIRRRNPRTTDATALALAQRRPPAMHGLTLRNARRSWLPKMAHA
jgi:hypothetical protein